MSTTTMRVRSRRALACALLSAILCTGSLASAPDADASTDDSHETASPSPDAQMLTAAAATPAFLDVARGDYFFDAVAWARNADVTKGTSPTTFSPGQAVPRWQVALFLRRFADWLGADTPTAAHGFLDVDHLSTEARSAIGWLKSTGITTGTSATTFDPDLPVTRAQMAAFLRRFADWVGLGPSVAPDSFTDTTGQSVEFRQAIGWLQTTQITTGTTPTTFHPAGSVSRGQMVTFLHRFAKIMRRASISSLLISPRDIEGVRCYVDDDLERNRPPAFVYPLEDAAQEAWEELVLKKQALAIAQDALDVAQGNAEPILDPRFIVDLDDQKAKIDLLSEYIGILAAELVVSELWAAELERRIASIEKTLADPGLTFENMFTEAGQEEWVEYLDQRYWDGGEGTLERVAEGALGIFPGGGDSGGLGLAVGEIGALGQELVFNSLIEHLAREKLPELKADLVEHKEHLQMVKDTMSAAEDELARLLAGSVSFTLFSPPSDAALQALAEAQADYDAAAAARDDAVALFEAAANAVIDDPYVDPWCDSPELLAGFVEIICEMVIPDFDPEPYPGYSDRIREGVAIFCEVVYAIDETYAELKLA